MASRDKNERNTGKPRRTSKKPKLDKSTHAEQINGDIKEPVTPEDALQVNEEKYRAILDQLDEGYYEVDLKGHYIYVNDALCRQSGYTKEEVLGSLTSSMCPRISGKRLLMHSIRCTGLVCPSGHSR